VLRTKGKECIKPGTGGLRGSRESVKKLAGPKAATKESWNNLEIKEVVVPAGRE